jgi:hypothetical protein
VIAKKLVILLGSGIPLLTGEIVVVHFRRGCELDSINNPAVMLGWLFFRRAIGLGAYILGFMRFSRFGFLLESGLVAIAKRKNGVGWYWLGVVLLLVLGYGFRVP